MHGEVLAIDASTGGGLWQSESLGTPIVHVYDVCCETCMPYQRWVPLLVTSSQCADAPSGESAYIEHRLQEMWPASAQYKQQLLGDGREPTAAESSTTMALQNEVFVGALPDGQLYALPRSPYTTFDFVQQVRHVFFVLFNSLTHGLLLQIGESAPAQLALPFRDANALRVATVASRDVVAVHDEDGIRTDTLITSRWLEHCAALWAGVSFGGESEDRDRGGVEYQCLIGVQNVSAALDSAVARSSLPPGMQQPVVESSGKSVGGGLVSTGIFGLSALAALAVVQFLGVPLHQQPLVARFVELGVISAPLLFSVIALSALVVRLVPILRRMSNICGRRPGRTHRRGRGGRVGGQVPPMTGTDASSASSQSSGAAQTLQTQQPQQQQPSQLHEQQLTTVVRGGIEHRVIGRLAVSQVVLGHGCHGTIVFAGEVC